MVATSDQRSSKANALPIQVGFDPVSASAGPLTAVLESMWSPPRTSVPPKQMLYRYSSDSSSFRAPFNPEPQCRYACGSRRASASSEPNLTTPSHRPADLSLRVVTLDG